MTIAYESFGSQDRETVLLIMGTSGQLTQWPDEHCAELTKRGYRVVRYDNRDIGLSTKFEAAGVPDFAAVLRAVGAGRPVPLAYTLYDMAAVPWASSMPSASKRPTSSAPRWAA